MKLYRLDYYQDDCDELIGFFTSKEAAMQYALHDRECHNPQYRTWTELWEFQCPKIQDLEERLDGMVERSQGLAAWEKGTNMNVTYYQ